MNPALRSEEILRSLAQSVFAAVSGLLILGGAQALEAQDPCPSASGPDAEAGWVAYQSGDMVEARARFESALDRCDNDHYSRTGLGYVALREGDTAEVVSLMQLVLRAEPNNVDALVGLGLANWRQGDLDGVRTNFERTIMIVPDHPTALDYLNRLSAEDGAEEGPRDAADQAWIDGDTEQAFELYSAQLNAEPEDAVALLRVGLLHAWSERYVVALEVLDRLVRLEPTNIDGRLARARVYAWSGDTPEAIREAGQILDVQPDNADARAALALFQSWSGQLDEALASYDELATIAPQYGGAQRQRAQVLAWAERYEQSLASFEALVEANPDDADARLGYARALGFSGDFDRAIAQYDQVLERSPEDIRALIGRSTVLGWAGRLADSERAALRAVDVDGGSGAAWASLGQVYQWQGRVGEALYAFESAAEFAPASAEIRDQLRSTRLSMASRARPSFTWARDSDGNRMLTTSGTASVYATSRLEVQGSAYRRTLEQERTSGRIENTAFGGMIEADVQVGSGWRVSAAVGGSVTDGVGDPSFTAFRAGVRTPERHAAVVSLDVSSQGLDETVALAGRGVRADDMLLSLRWSPAPLWRVDGVLGEGRYEGTEENRRRSGYIGASRRIGGFFSLGASLRGFSFEKNLSDGYFDPDVYGVAELTAYWLYRPASWSFLVEAAPGLQKIGRDGDPTGSVRTHTRAGFRLGSAREVFLSYRYSTARLVNSATGQDGYNYSALTIGFDWAF